MVPSHLSLTSTGLPHNCFQPKGVLWTCMGSCSEEVHNFIMYLAKKGSLWLLGNDVLTCLRTLLVLALLNKMKHCTLGSHSHCSRLCRPSATSFFYCWFSDGALAGTGSQQEPFTFVFKGIQACSVKITVLQKRERCSVVTVSILICCSLVLITPPNILPS